MNSTPLIYPYRPDAVFAYRDDGPITRARFLAQTLDLANELPDRPTVINLVADRYGFTVTFAAALLRGQVTLLPPSRAPAALGRLAEEYSESYCLTDGDETIAGLQTFRFSLRDSPVEDSNVPEIPLDRIAAVVFTSGSTGIPKPNQKTWQGLSTVARRTGARLAPGDPGPKERGITIVATVPHWHMFGLETSIMLPLQYGLVFYAGKPLYPEDVRLATERVPGPRALITTPLHLRACLFDRTVLSELAFILSATAPLSRAMAMEAETAYQTRVYEVYGFAEAGTVATRRTVADDAWQVLEGIHLCRDAGQHVVEADYLARRLPFPDRISALGSERFVLHGRNTDLVNIGGRRASLSDLNHHLNAVDGVRDGTFFLPADAHAFVSRLVAFVVAPGKSGSDILSELRKTVDPVFLPRPIYLVAGLPRNETGKLTHEAMCALERACRLGEFHGD